MAETGDNKQQATSDNKEPSMPAERIAQFLAKDAMHYVDSYRSASKKQAEILKEQLEIKQKRLWDDKGVSTTFYAEMRALEDALKHVIKGEDPGWVVLGDPSQVSVETGCDPAELEKCQKALAAGGEERLKLEGQYKDLLAKAQELQGVAVNQRQEIAVLRRRLEQNSSTFMVVVATMFVVILVQLYLLWTH